MTLGVVVSMKSQIKKLFIFSVIGVFLITIAISFAYWQDGFQQKEKSVVQTECFQVNFSEGQGIFLHDAYPMNDEDGMLNPSYDFTITNVCNSSARYQINLETFLPEGKQLPDKYLKSNLMEDTTSKITTKLLSELAVTPTILNAVSSYKLLEGVLASREEKEFHLRIWMHSDVTANDLDSMNAMFQGKVSVVTSFIKTAADTIKNLPIVTTGNGLYEVSHEDANITYTEDIELQNRLKQTEYRYAGSNPDNYIKFNNELWRIIGLVNTPEGQRVKIRRLEGIQAGSWDSSVGENGGYGVNEWSQSDMMNILNYGLYYRRSAGQCYAGQHNITMACDFSSNGLLDESKEFIDTITWNTGSNGWNDASKSITKQFYDYERSNNTGKMNCNANPFCTDTATRQVTWKGNVGLMYPSDYGYATSGNAIANREACLNTSLYQWKNVACTQNNWLFTQNYQWTMMAYFHNGYAVYGSAVYSDGTLVHFPVYNILNVNPVVFLKSSLEIIGGNGTINSPYEIGF